MASIADNLIALNTEKHNLAANLTTKGVTSADTEPIADLVAKVLDITGGEANWSIINGNIYPDTASYDRVIVPDNTYQWVQTGIDMTKDWIAYSRIQFLESDDFLNYEFWIDTTVQFAIGFGLNWVTVAKNGESVSVYDYIDTTQKVLLGTSNFYTTPKKIIIWYDHKWGYLNVYVDNVLIGSHKPSAGGTVLDNINTVKVKTGSGIDIQCTFDYQYMAYPLMTAIGDSITAGAIAHAPNPAHYAGVDTYGSNYCKLVSDYLQTKGIRNYFVVNKGVNSETTANMETRFATDITATGCKYVLVHGGINDYAGADTAITIGNKEDMAGAAVTASIKPFILGVIPTKTTNAAHDYSIDLHVAEQSAYASYKYIDLWESIEGATADVADDALMADTVHPNLNGYTAIATYICQKFEV